MGLVETIDLQYAHRKCVQHWCNEKGDITCEICHQVCLCLVVLHRILHVVRLVRGLFY